MDGEKRLQNRTIIKDIEAKNLQYITFPKTKIAEENGQKPDKLEESGLMLLGLVGLKDPCLLGVWTTVESCRKARVDFKLIIEENTQNAIALAVECVILNPDMDLNGEVVVNGAEFREYSPRDKMEKIENIRVMAECSMFDKLLLIRSLKKKGHVVAHMMHLL